MAIDPSIPLGVRPVVLPPLQIQTPLEQFGKVLSLRALMQQSQQRGLEIEQLQRAAEATEAINRVLRGEAPPGTAVAPGTVPAAPAPAAPGLPAQPQIGGVPEGAFWLPKPAPAVAPTAAPAPGGGTLPGGSVSLSQLASLTPRLLQAGGVAALPIVENISKAAKAQLDQHISVLDLEKRESEATARLVGGITDDDSLKSALVVAANKGKISWDDVRRYSDLGFANPATQNYLKQKGLESLDYDKRVELALKEAKQQREALEQGKGDFAQQVKMMTDIKQFAPLLAEQPPEIQKFYRSLGGITDLEEIKKAVAGGSIKAEQLATTIEAERHNRRVEELTAQGHDSTTANQIATKEATLRDDFTQVTKDFRMVRDAYGLTQTLIAQPKGGVRDIGLIYNWMKMIDPGSRVTGSEEAMASNAGGVAESIRNLYNRLLKGEVLSDETFNQIVGQINSTYQQKLQDHQKTVDQYRDIAVRQKVDPKNVIVDFTTTAPVKETPPPKPTYQTIERIDETPRGRVTAPIPIAPQGSAQLAVPPEVQKALAGVERGKIHQLSDGSVWLVNADGSIQPATAPKQ
jgi:hypothetical protein